MQLIQCSVMKVGHKGRGSVFVGWCVSLFSESTYLPTYLPTYPLYLSLVRLRYANSTFNVGTNIYIFLRTHFLSFRQLQTHSLYLQSMNKALLYYSTTSSWPPAQFSFRSPPLVGLVGPFQLHLGHHFFNAHYVWEVRERLWKCDSTNANGTND